MKTIFHSECESHKTLSTIIPESVFDAQANVANLTAKYNTNQLLLDKRGFSVISDFVGRGGSYETAQAYLDMELQRQIMRQELDMFKLWAAKI